MVKSQGGTTPRSKEERPPYLAIEKYLKDKNAFISALVSSLHVTYDENAASRAVPHLVHMLRDPDVDTVLAAASALNTLLNEAYSAIFDTEYVLDTLCRCFSHEIKKEIDDETVQRVIVEVTSGIISAWALMEPSSLDHSINHLIECIKPCIVCLKSDKVDLQLSALRIISAIYDPRIRGDVDYGEVVQIFDHVIPLISNDTTRVVQTSLNVLTRAMKSLSPARIEEILGLAYTYIRDESMDEESTSSAMNFLESSIVHNPVSPLIDNVMCDILCRYVEKGIESERSTSILALQILARLVNEDEKFSPMLEKSESIMDKISYCVEDIESSRLLPSLFIIGHVSKSSRSSCEFFLNHKINITKCVGAVLVHCEQPHIQQVAAWVLGVLGSSTATSARTVTESGALLAMIDVISKSVSDEGEVARTCIDSCTTTIENLEYLEALEALLKIDGLHVDIIASVFQRLSILLTERRILCADFVQSGSLEVFIALGENQPHLKQATQVVCDLYPPDLVNRCSPKYMNGLIEKFKRESIRQSVSIDLSGSSIQPPESPTDSNDDIITEE